MNGIAKDNFLEKIEGELLKVPFNDQLAPMNPSLKLPHKIIDGLLESGMTQLHQWQLDCLLTTNILETSANLVYSCPTGAGKTLVAEIIMLKRCLETRKRCIYVLPFVSIVIELTTKLQRFYGSIVNVAGYYGNESQANKFDDVDIAVCTIEKANSLINRLIEEGSLDLVTTLIVDELHMISNPGRGYLIELMLTKILLSKNDIKIVGMSASLPNIHVLAKWLNAKLYLTNFRPIPLNEFIKVGGDIFDGSGILKRRLKINRNEAKNIGDPDSLISIIYETVSTGNSVILFCAKKVECENCALLVSKLMVIVNEPEYERQVRIARRKLLDELKSLGVLDRVLNKTISKGIAYHHSGLTEQERCIIEDGFKNGVINVICATSTLASGVNLPARRVIFRSPYIGRSFLTAQDYAQMRGRAGRYGLDTAGESIIMCSKTEYKKVLDLVKTRAQVLESCLATSKLGMNRAILEAIVNGMAKSKDELECLDF